MVLNQLFFLFFSLSLLELIFLSLFTWTGKTELVIGHNSVLFTSCSALISSINIFQFSQRSICNWTWYEENNVSDTAVCPDQDYKVITIIKLQQMNPSTSSVLEHQTLIFNVTWLTIYISDSQNTSSMEVSHDLCCSMDKAFTILTLFPMGWPPTWNSLW